MIEFAHAANTTAQQSPMSNMLFPMILIMFVAYMLLMRPQKKQAEKLISGLEKNDEVILSTGIVGKITKVGDLFITVEIAPGVEITVQKHPNLIASKLEKGAIKAIAKGTFTFPTAKNAKTKKETVEKAEKIEKNKKEEKKEEKKAGAANTTSFDEKANATSFSEEEAVKSTTENDTVVETEQIEATSEPSNTSDTETK